MQELELSAQTSTLVQWHSIEMYAGFMPTMRLHWRPAKGGGPPARVGMTVNLGRTQLHCGAFDEPWEEDEEDDRPYMTWMMLEYCIEVARRD